VREIEAHYGKFILALSDAISGRALLDTAGPVGGENVMPLPRGLDCMEMHASLGLFTLFHSGRAASAHCHGP
jgi:hypothetical protein